MPIKVLCDSCFTDLKVADQHAGKKIKCRECGEVLTIPVPQRGVRPAEPRRNKVEDAWDESELEDADDADELTAAPRSTKSSSKKKKKKKSSNNWYDWQNLQQNPFALALVIELFSAIPGCFSTLAMMLFGLVWGMGSALVLVLSMFGGLLAAIVLNPTAMATSLVAGRMTTNHLAKKGVIKIQEQSPVYDFLMKSLLISLCTAVLGILLLIIQVFMLQLLWGRAR
ncbi:MAG: hypothetical protein V4719_13455 [Planctomycetota bacterium]